MSEAKTYVENVLYKMASDYSDTLPSYEIKALRNAADFITKSRAQPDNPPQYDNSAEWEVEYARQKISKWPKWKQELSKQIFSEPPHRKDGDKE